MSAIAQSALQLRDIHLPASPGLWPPAPGWWIVFAVSVALLTWGIAFAARKYHVHRRRQRIIADFGRLEQELASKRSPEVLARISALLRRIALTRYPRQQIAPLNGETWLKFLDASGGNGRFSTGPGSVLASGPYQRSTPIDLETADFGALVRDWINKNTKDLP